MKDSLSRQRMWLRESEYYKIQCTGFNVQATYRWVPESKPQIRSPYTRRRSAESRPSHKPTRHWQGK